MPETELMWDVTEAVKTEYAQVASNIKYSICSWTGGGLPPRSSLPYPGHLNPFVTISSQPLLA